MPEKADQCYFGHFFSSQSQSHKNKTVKLEIHFKAPIMVSFLRSTMPAIVLTMAILSAEATNLRATTKRSLTITAPTPDYETYWKKGLVNLHHMPRQVGTYVRAMEICNSWQHLCVGLLKYPFTTDDVWHILIRGPDHDITVSADNSWGETASLKTNADNEDCPPVPAGCKYSLCVFRLYLHALFGSIRSLVSNLDQQTNSFRIITFGKRLISMVPWTSWRPYAMLIQPAVDLIRSLAWARV